MQSARQRWNARFAYISCPIPYLGAGLIFAAFLNGLHNFHASDPAEPPPLFPFIDGALGGALVFGILFAVVSIALAREDNGFLLHRRRVRVTLGISTGCMLCGCVFLAATTAVSETAYPFALTLFGTVFGIGGLSSAVLWGTAYAKLEPQSNLFSAAASLSIACLFNLAVELVGSPLFTYMLCAVLVMLGSYLLLIASYGDARGSGREAADAGDRRETPDRNIASSADTERQADGGEAFSGRKRATDAAKQLWMPLVGAVLATFIFGLTWDPVASEVASSQEVLTVVLRSLAGPLITSSIIMIAVVRKPDSSVVRIIQSALFPLAIAMLLALPVIESENTLVTAFVALLDKASFSVIIVSIWTAITNASRTTRIPVHILLPLCLGILGGSAFLGLNLIHVIGTNGKTLCLVLFAIYLALIATSFAINTRAERASIIVETAGPNKSIQQRADELAEQHGLSPREIEVLYLLGRGYNHGYIATRLFISENTVRTHVRHIYSKLELSSREDLIELIDQVGE